ncbi:MAG: RidA family protein [Rhodospirillaceae bacterium]
MTIERKHSNARMSQVVATDTTVYLAGQVAKGASVAEQTTAILAAIDGYLAEMGSDKSKVLQVTIWLTDMSTFAEMNQVYDAWVHPEHKPARACVESKLAAPEYKVEIMVTAAR